MNANAHSAKPLALLAGSLAMALVAGCAQMPARDQAAPAADAGSQPSSQCNPALTGAVGALAGALFGKGKGHIVGAVVGAGIGALACVAYNYHARKVRSASSVEAEYKQQRGALPSMNTVSSYASSLQPSSTVQAGKPVEMQSSIVVVNGTRDTQPKLAETLTLIGPDGKQLSTATKQAADINGTGEYQTSFNFNLPKGIPDGRYTVRSTLTMNGRQVGSNQMPMLVVG